MKKIIISIIAMLISGAVIMTPVFAAAGECVKTGIVANSTCNDSGEEVDRDENNLNCLCDDGQGGAIKYVLKLVLDIMTVGIGILAILGVTIVGIQYLTAGGNEEQVRKSKRRLLEIVIGIVAYVLIYALLGFLIPDFNI